MGKAKRAAKKARKLARGTAEEAAIQAQEAAAARVRERWRLILLVAPVVVAAVTLVLYAVADEPQLAGIVALGGAVVWFPLWLGNLGAGVAPRDRRRAGGIDFGNR